MAISFSRQSANYFKRPHVAIPEHPIDHPGAWYGAQFPDGVPVTSFSRAHVEELENVGARWLASGGAPGEASKDDFSVSDALLQLLTEAVSEVHHGRGFALLRGLPVEKWDVQLSEAVFWGMGLHMGYPGEQNPQGERLGHVQDYGEEDSNPLVRRYRTPGNIDFHCDGADMVGFDVFADRKDRRTKPHRKLSHYFQRVVATSSGGYPAAVSAYDARPARRAEPGGDPSTPIQPSCFDGEILRTFYHSEYYRSASRHEMLDSAAEHLLDAYDAIASREDVYLDMWLQPGDVQLVSNHSVVHARTAYEDSENSAHRRHLLRLWLSFYD